MICFGQDFNKYSLFSNWINTNKKFIRLNGDDYSIFKELQSFLSINESMSKPYEIVKFETTNDKLNYLEESIENEDDEDSYYNFNRMNVKEYEDEPEYDDEGQYDNEEQYDDQEKSIDIFIRNDFEDFNENNSKTIIGNKRYRNDE